MAIPDELIQVVKSTGYLEAINDVLFLVKANMLKAGVADTPSWVFELTEQIIDLGDNK